MTTATGSQSWWRLSTWSRNVDNKVCYFGCLESKVTIWATYWKLYSSAICEAVTSQVTSVTFKAALRSVRWYHSTAAIPRYFNFTVPDPSSSLLPLAKETSTVATSGDTSKFKTPHLNYRNETAGHLCVWSLNFYSYRTVNFWNCSISWLFQTLIW